MACGTVSNLRRRPGLPPQPMLTLCYLRKLIQRRKNYAAAEYSFSGEIIIHGGCGLTRKLKFVFEKTSQCRNLSHSAANNPFYILIHCETIPYPYTLPKTLSVYIAETILMYCRSYTLSLYIAETIPYFTTLSHILLVVRL